MARNPIKIITFIITILLALITAFIIWGKNTYVETMPTQHTEHPKDTSTIKNPTNIEEEDNIANEKISEEKLALALKGLNLFQGEHGIELWNLKAAWAYISQDGTTIKVNNPIIHYTLGDGSKKEYIKVIAHKGAITDNKKNIVLHGNVTISYGNKILIGEKMIYNSTDRTLFFPIPVKLQSPNISGTIGNLLWDLDQNTLLGKKPVTITINHQ